MFVNPGGQGGEVPAESRFLRDPLCFCGSARDSLSSPGMAEKRGTRRHKDTKKTRQSQLCSARYLISPNGASHASLWRLEEESQVTFGLSSKP